MSISNNRRPGVYSTYTVDSAYATPRTRQYAALVIKGSESMAGTLFTYDSYEAAAAQLKLFSGNETVLECVRILFDSGVAGVHVSMVDSNVSTPLSLLALEDNIGAIVCEMRTEAHLAELKQHLQGCVDTLRERIAFTCADTVEDAKRAAGFANHERIVLCCPASVPKTGGEAKSVYTAAAMAGAVLGADSPVYSWNNCRMEELVSCSRLEERDIQDLLGCGVTVMENRGGEVSCIRAVTTKTRTGGVEDVTMRSVNTILIIDDVLRTIRDSLRGKLSGRRISMDSIKAQVTVELAAKQDDGIIEAFSVPAVYADKADPSVCVVEIAFHAAHVLSQIHISAYVRV